MSEEKDLPKTGAGKNAGRAVKGVGGPAGGAKAAGDAGEPIAREDRTTREDRSAVASAPAPAGAALYAGFKIYPSIGVARVGNSPDDYFIGPETPGEPADNGGAFRDSQGRVKRQAARFRIYACDQAGKPLRELTSADADITWTVHLANRKAAWQTFVGEPRAKGIAQAGSKVPLRNPDEKDRGKLVIDPGSRSISGRSAVGPEYRFDSGKFYDRVVPLGELRTDDQGRLLVLGGFGHSDTILSPAENPIRNYANNDLWYDDTADGPVSARVVLKSGRELYSRGDSRVLVAPPDFAPETENLVTLYDVMEEVAINGEWLPDPGRVSFRRRIYPILQRIVGYQWVNALAVRGHGPGRPGDFLDQDRLKRLASPGKEAEAERQGIFSRIRAPKTLNPAGAEGQALYFYMPPLSGDGGDTAEGEPDKWLTLSARQYRAMQSWARGDFLSDFDPSEGDRPQAGVADGDSEAESLTRAVLQACVGGAFFPGIEMTYIARDPQLYVEPFRLDNTKLGPGEVNMWMALPWQADFYECRGNWWPAQRPDDVVSDQQFESVRQTWRSTGQPGQPAFAAYLFDRVAWDRGVGTKPVERPNFIVRPVRGSYDTAADDDATAKREQELFEKDTREFEDMLRRQQKAAPAAAAPRVFPPDQANYRDSPQAYHRASVLYEDMLRRQWALARRYVGDNDMVRLWSQLGFLVCRPAPDNSLVLVETERDRYAGLQHREYFHIMMNLDAYPDFLPKARQLADEFLAETWAQQGQEGTLDDELVFFAYSPTAYDARLDEIYNGLAQAADSFRPDAPDVPFKSRRDMVERIRQLSPFNLIDGGWLRNATNAGPISEIHSLLFSIWSDEVGGGDPRLSHSNLYLDLMHSVRLNPEAINTREFAFDPKLLDSAFRNPVFQLVVSQFSDLYFPEILGMTLQLEWEVLELKQTIKLMNYFNLNPTFYEMHVGIDNAADGHGAKARRAVQTYLDHVRVESGEKAVQEHWRRIWNGYVAFRTIGMGDDLRALIDYPPGVEDRLVEMIQRKAIYGRMNHGERQLGQERINDLFDDPGRLLQGLKDAQYVIPGHPESSRFFKLLEFSGPMYKVFNDEEVELWKEWVQSLPQAADGVDEPARPEKPSEPEEQMPNPARGMAELIVHFRVRQQASKAHDQLHLAGDDPDAPGTHVVQPVSWWFAKEPPALMRALRDEENGLVVPGNAAASPLMTQLASTTNRMGLAFAEPIPQSPNRTWRDVAADWINAGCPLPDEVPRPRLAPDERDRARVLSVPSHPATVQAATTGSTRTHGIQPAPGAPESGPESQSAHAMAAVGGAAMADARGDGAGGSTGEGTRDRAKEVSRQIAHLLESPDSTRPMNRPKVPRLGLNTPRSRMVAHPIGRILGNGTVH